MAEDKQKSTPPPVLLSAIICDRVIIDKRTNQPSIIGAFETVNAFKYPARHSRLAFFCQLTNGHGKVFITIRLVDVQDEEKSLFEQKIEHEFTDVRRVDNLTFNIEGIPFPHPGEYRFQIFAGTTLLSERRIICREIQMPSGDMNNEHGTN
jgi:hypothetical protein